MHDLRNVMSMKRRVEYFLRILLILVAFVAGCSSMQAREDVLPEQAVAPRQITGITVTGSGSADPAVLDRLIISGNSNLPYTSVKKNQPTGVVFYFPQTSLADIQSETEPDSDIIALIKADQQPEQGNSRIEVDLKKDAAYKVRRNGNNLEVTFNAIPSPAARNAITEKDVAVKRMENKPASAMSKTQPAVEIKEEGAGPHAVTAQKESAPASLTHTSGKPAVISRLDFSSMESGKSAVIIGTTEPVDFNIDKIADQTLRIRLFNSRLPEFRRHRPLITTRFDSAVDRISPVQTSEKDHLTDIIIELRESVPYHSVQEGKEISVYFDPSSIGPRPYEAANLPPWRQVLEKAEPVQAVSSAAPSESRVTEIQPAGPSDEYSKLMYKKRYTGQKIALDFYKTDIKNVFRILQQVSGKNYAIDKNVNGEVTISLEKPCPWDEVLDLVCKMNQLGTIPEGNIIRIATLNTIRNEENARKDQIKAMKEREEQQKTLEPLVTEYVPVNYADAAKEILPHLQDLKTSRGTITVDQRNNQLIITDTRESIEKQKKVIAQIDKVTPQVQIEARIVEVSDSYSREVGFGWTASGKDIYRNDLGGQYGYNIAMNTPFKGDEDSTGLISYNFERQNAWGTPFVLDAQLRAMEQEGKGKIISSPKILTMDNKSAMIKQGMRIPYQTVTGVGANQTTSTEFEDVDLLLQVTPHVTPDRRISLNIETTKNEIVGYQEQTGDPITSTNEASTKLLVDDGDTIVIGGVLKTTLQNSETGYPVLKDMPIVGWMFKDVSRKNQKNELLIFMTPRIIQLKQKDLVQVEAK